MDTLKKVKSGAGHLSRYILRNMSPTGEAWKGAIKDTDAYRLLTMFELIAGGRYAQQYIAGELNTCIIILIDYAGHKEVARLIQIVRKLMAVADTLPALY